VRRRGFLGALAAAVAASRVAPNVVSEGTVRSAETPFLASGVVRHEYLSAPVDGPITVEVDGREIMWNATRDMPSFVRTR